MPGAVAPFDPPSARLCHEHSAVITATETIRANCQSTDLKQPVWIRLRWLLTSLLQKNGETVTWSQLDSYLFPAEPA